MIPAFWDASSVVPLCLEQQSTAVARDLARQYQFIVWWSTQVEVRSAFARLLRMGEITAAQQNAAGQRLDTLRRHWREMQPANDLRAQAEAFLTLYPLKAADALQLAAAWVWCSGTPRNRVFISADVQLLEAARQVGFQIVAT